ncbi:mechanosensitive ion channel domain-containing protein [uncultured Paracoccus sp.]|uniref:mechanosensitive ion channel family protein n=1 Tax=uncultured Paracoccus sp. TaxID=189685 RepID=UPI002613A141|nr:mechanosensitive ion channel domain-containing protein [uncultured Paracoccus sp.]
MMRPAPQLGAVAALIRLVIAVVILGLSLSASGPALAQVDLPGGEAETGAGENGSDSDETFPADQPFRGLAPAADHADLAYRDTPFGSVSEFLELGSNGDFRSAAWMLDLTEIPVSERATRGPELAAMLYAVLDRKVLIDWQALNDRPDALYERASDQNPLAGESRRSIAIGVVTLNGRALNLRLNRLQPEGSDASPVWVFARQTLRYVPEMYDAFGPTPVERAMPEVLRQKAFWGLRWWEALVVPLLVGASVVLARVLYIVITSLGERTAEATAMRFIVRSLRWPMIILTIAVLVDLIASNVFVLSGRIEAVLRPAVLGAYSVATILFVVTLLDRIASSVVKTSPDDLADQENAAARNAATAISAVRKFVLVVASVIAIGVVLAGSNVLPSLGFSLLASAGVISLIFGFAAREVLSNIIASLQIALNGSARIGDQLIYDGEWCTVEKINLTYVQLRVWTDARLIVPVADFVAEAFENRSIENKFLTWPVEVTLAHTADVEALRNRYADLVRELDDPDSVDMDGLQVLVIEHSEWGQRVRFYFPSDHPSTGWTQSCQIREAVIAEAARIEAETGRQMLPQIDPAAEARR